jgi:hypothetical protein
MAGNTLQSFMKILLKLFFSVLSLILALLLTVILNKTIKLYGDIRTDSYMQDVNDAEWGSGENRLTSKVQDSADRSENQYLTLSVLDADNEIVFKKELVIYRDRWSSGFLKLMQVDDDPELEIVFYAYKSAEFNLEKFKNDTYPVSFSFYLDVNPDKIEVRNFKNASVSAQELAEMRLLTAKNFTLQFILMLSIPVLAILIYRYFLARIFKLAS